MDPSTSDTVKMQNPAPPPNPVAEVGVNQNRLAAFCAGVCAELKTKVDPFILFREALSETGALYDNDAKAVAFAELSDGLCARLLGAQSKLRMALVAKAQGGAK